MGEMKRARMAGKGIFWCAEEDCRGKMNMRGGEGRRKRKEEGEKKEEGGGRKRKRKMKGEE